jgi:hypothetical protein
MSLELNQPLTEMRTSNLPAEKVCPQLNGRAIAQAFSRWLPTAAARVRILV